VVEWLDNIVTRRGQKTDQSLVYGLLYAQRILPLYTLDPMAATTARSAPLEATRASVPRGRRAAPPARAGRHRKRAP
jgi:hypothetical protein